MAQAETRLSRRAMLSASVLLSPAARGAPARAAPALPAPPAGHVWVCVQENAWRQFAEAMAVLAALDAGRG